MAIIYASSASQSDVVSALASASSGDVVLIPAGAATWGASSSQVAVPSGVTLRGNGEGSTVVALSATGQTYSKGVITLAASSVLRHLTIEAPSGSTGVSAVSCSGDDWRIANVTYNGTAGSAGYFAYTGGYGVIDHCTFDAPNGSQELIFGRGPTDSWQTAHSMGGADNVFIEDCTFDGAAYVCDANSNARFVTRRNTINGQIKIDGHGKYSNTPPRGVRHMEVYDNEWTTDGFWTAIEIRGGTGRVFNNTKSGASAWMFLAEYYVLQGGLDSSDYPIDDQIGVGIDPKAAASEPMYLWGNREGGSRWDPEPTVFGESMAGVIDADRDYFTEGASFDGTSGVGIGTKAAMEAITPTTTGVGFWVTDEGSWDTTLPANTSGQLYVWGGAEWVLDYTPYTYPHPLAASMADSLTLNQVTNTDPVTELWRRGADLDGAASDYIVQHSGDYPTQPDNDFRYLPVRGNGDHVMVLAGTVSLATAQAKRNAVDPL